MSERTRIALDEQCKAKIDELREYVSGADSDDTEFEPLDLYTVRDSRGELARIELLACCGGPTVWIDVTPGDMVRARGYWGAESLNVSARIVGAWGAFGEVWV